MTNCTTKKIAFPACNRRKVVANFTGGDVSSDGGILLLREIDRKLQLSKSLSKCFKDERDQNKIEHTVLDLVRQRMYGLALGYEDLNDHTTLRNDPGFQTGVNRNEILASSSTLCRFENSLDKSIFWDQHNLMVDVFIKSFGKKIPKQLILDFDATDDPLHGKQFGSYFNGYYKKYCFLPLYVFCGDQPLVSYLRPSNIDGSKHAGSILRWLVKKLRRSWPDVKIVFRGDSAFCRKRTLYWCENNNVDYVVGITTNSRLKKSAQPIMNEVEEQFKKTKCKQKEFDEFYYSAKSWNSEDRRIIVKAEYNKLGSNTRFIITSLKDEASVVYNDIYCARGEMENKIKEQQLCLFADRTSCQDWWSNQLRLLFSTFAYILLDSIRRIGLHNTILKRARCDTIRLKLLEVGAIILQNTRSVKFLLPTSYPYKDLFYLVVNRLALE